MIFVASSWGHSLRSLAFAYIDQLYPPRVAQLQQHLRRKTITQANFGLEFQSYLRSGANACQLREITYN